MLTAPLPGGQGLLLMNVRFWLPVLMGVGIVALTLAVLYLFPWSPR